MRYAIISHLFYITFIQPFLTPCLLIAPAHQYRLVFLLNLAEPLAKLLDDPVLEHDVLPRLYPYLTSSVNPELFESAHSLVLAVFAAKKPIAKELSSIYAKIIIEVRCWFILVYVKCAHHTYSYIYIYKQ